MPHAALAPFFALLTLFQAAPPPQSELAEINGTLKEIAALLRQQVSAQRGDLLLKRLTFAQSQLSAAEERLKRVVQDAQAMRMESADLEGRIAHAEKERGPDESEAAHGARVVEMRRMLTRYQERITALGEERAAAENQVAAMRRDAGDWQNQLDKLLGRTP